MKRVAEAGLAAVARIGLTRARVARKTLILAYHNIVPDDAAPDGDRPLHLPLRTFKAHLDVLEEHCEIVGLGDIDRSPTKRPRAAITFDDAYRGAVELGLGELHRRAISATVFVSPAYLGGATFWWDDVARALGRPLDAELRVRALVEWRGREAEIRSALPESAEAAREAPSHMRCCDTGDLRRAASSPFVTLGSHSWSHPNLTRLSPAELTTEVGRARDWLIQEFPGITLPALSYPYGLVSGEVRSATVAAGYTKGLIVMGGWSDVASDPLILPRKNVPAGLSASGLAIRLAGMIAP